MGSMLHAALDAAALFIQARWRAQGARRLAAVQARLRDMSTCVVCMQENAYLNSRCVCGAVTCRPCTIAMNDATCCPVCRQTRALTPQDAGMKRLFAATALRLQCPHCNVYFSADAHDAHAARCSRRVHDCPMRGCPFRGVQVELHAHLAEAHETPVLQRGRGGEFEATILMTPAVHSLVLCLDDGGIVVLRTATRNVMLLFESPGAPLWLQFESLIADARTSRYSFVVEQHHDGEVVDRHLLSHPNQSFGMVPRSRGVTTMHHGEQRPSASSETRQSLADRNRVKPHDGAVPVAVMTVTIRRVA